MKAPFHNLGGVNELTTANDNSGRPSCALREARHVAQAPLPTGPHQNLVESNGT